MFYEWTGRIDEKSKGKRFHQVVENINVRDVEKSNDRQIGIVGFECDEGVRRNQGRTGAKEAPNRIRKLLGNIPYHDETKSVIDIGNVQCADTDLEGAQAALGSHITQLIQKNYTPIILGGGHETFYGHYLGVRNAVGANKKIGMINLDAHFDLRVDDTPSSGTMFRQILETDKNANYLCVGVQELGNTEQLFVTADELNVEYILETNLDPLEQTCNKIDEFAKKQDYVIYTICTDVINQAYAPGVSAPAPFGLKPDTVRKITEHVVKRTNFLSMDVSEVNPSLDIDDQTARLISYIIAETFMHLNRR